jgi:hypothetical protein
LELLLDAQRRAAEVKIEYYQSLVEYNRSILQVHFRKGSLLEYNGIVLAEGPWPAKAYFDAESLARRRDASYYFDYGYTRPRVVSRGPVHQRVSPPFSGDFDAEGEVLFEDVPPEEIPAPQPTPADEPEVHELIPAGLQPSPGPTASGPSLEPPAGPSTSHSVFDWGTLGLSPKAKPEDPTQTEVQPAAHQE